MYVVTPEGECRTGRRGKDYFSPDQIEIVEDKE